MTYYSQVLRLQPLASWPLKETSYVTAEDISGNNIDATYSGDFAKGLPLVSNGESGTIFLNGLSEIQYPITNIMTSRKEYKSFSLEMSFLVNCDDRYLTNSILIFGQDFDGDLQGLYLENNYIYFKPSYTENYVLKYQVNNWNQKFHVVISYNQAQIIMYINGKQVDIRNSSDYVSDPSNYLQDIDGFYSKGSSEYPFVLDSVTVYQDQISPTSILNHYLESNSASNYNLYLSELAKPYYKFSVENQINAYTASLDRYLPEEKFVKTSSYVSLPYIEKQFINGTIQFEEVDGRDCLYLESSYFEIKELLESKDKIYKTLGISFYLDTSEEKPENTLLYALSENATIEAFITNDNTLNINVNGESASIELTTGWHDILFVSDNNCSVYVDGEEEISADFYIGNYIYILVGSSFNQTNYFNGYVSYLSLASSAPLDNLNYERDAELYLEMSKNMQWSQDVSHEFIVYIPDSINLYGSHAVSKYTSPRINITYNNDQAFPRNSKLPELAGGVQSEEVFTVNLNMFTEDSENDLPRLYDFYINAFTDYGKNIFSSVNGVPATANNIDEVMLGKSLNSFIYKSSDIGAIVGNTTVEFPGILNNTQTVSLMGRFLNWDGNERVLLNSKGPYWDDTRTNLILNSNIETNTNYFVALNTNMTITRTTAASFIGNSSLAVENTGLVANKSFAFDNDLAPPGRINLLPNTTYRISWYMRSDNLTSNRVAAVGRQFFDSNGTSLGAATFTNAATYLLTSAGTWLRRDVSFTTPANTATGQISIRLASQGPNEIFYYDGFLLEASTTLNPYVDNGPKIWWNGTSWQTRGINSIFFNGGSNIDEDAISSHYFYITATLNTPATPQDNLVIGPDFHALILTQNESIEDSTAIEEQYLVLNGIALEPLRSSPEDLTIIDKGLSVYNFVWQSI
jgi:hypothetical protein